MVYQQKTLEDRIHPTQVLKDDWINNISTYWLGHTEHVMACTRSIAANVSRAIRNTRIQQRKKAELYQLASGRRHSLCIFVGYTKFYVVEHIDIL